MPRRSTPRTVMFVATLLATTHAAQAREAADRSDTFTTTVSTQASREDRNGADTIINGAVGLQWQHGPISLGATLGASGSSVQLPSVIEAVNTSSFNGGLSFGLAIGKSALELDFGYSRQGLSGNVTAANGLADGPGNTPLQLSGSVVSTSVGGGFSHAFGHGALDITPRLALSYDRTRTSAALNGRNRAPAPGFVKTSEGVSITPELDIGYAFSDRFSLSGSAAFTAASNGSASRIARRPLAAGLVQTAQQNDSATQWGSFALAARVVPFGHLAIVPTVGTTVGRSINEFFAGTTLSLSF